MHLYHKNCGQARARGFLAGDLPLFELLFRIQRQLDHSLEQLICRRSRKIFQHQFFNIQPHQVTRLQRAIARWGGRLANMWPTR